MDDPNITMEEYIRLEEEKARRHDKDNDDDKVDIKHSSGDLSLKPLPDVINTDVGAYAHSTFDTVYLLIEYSVFNIGINMAYPGKFLRALPTKWRPKVMAVKESKDLSTLPLDELIGNLKLYEVMLEKDSEISKGNKEKYKSLALKARKPSNDEEVSCSKSNDEESAMTVRDFKKFFKRRGMFFRTTKRTFERLRKTKRIKRIVGASSVVIQITS
nr:UBN2 domain-containing protein [Tanacetum cinerariifolium]